MFQSDGTLRMIEPVVGKTVGPSLAPTKRFAIALSDIHIGNGAATCWYQPAHHEHQLTRVLSWIVARRSVIREVVLLGDIFDLWTYAPSVRPPSMSDIVSANPTLLGRQGPFATLVRALPGQVRLVLGNHDGSLSSHDVDVLNRSLGGNAARGERIELVTAPSRVVTGSSGKRTVFSHGHHWCMFNAPDPRSRWDTIPIGHFITRAISYQLSRTLKPGQTAADLRGSGNPNGVALGAVIRSWNQRDDLAGWLLDYICRVTGLPKSEPIVMPDGSTTTVAQAAQVFRGLFSLWVRLQGRRVDAVRAAAADWRGADLAWFAQRLALQTASDLAVMGHTHVPVGGLAVSPVNYVNGGYECVSAPDAPSARSTFTIVDLEEATAQVLALVRTARGSDVVPVKAPVLPSAIQPPAVDFSCYAHIANAGERTLRLVTATADAGSYWVVPPPAEIRPHTNADVWVQDSPGLRGSRGRFTYTDGARTLEFILACPTGIAGNVVRSPVPNYQTRAGSSGWHARGVDHFGHPVQARFVVGAARGSFPAPQAAPTSPGASVPIGESPHVVAARAILARADTTSERGVVLCVAHLSTTDGSPLLDSTTEPSRTSPTGRQLKNPPAHILGPDVQTITLPNGTTYPFVWIQPNLPPVSPPLAGGMAFLPAPGASRFTLVTFNVAGLDNDYRRRCTNGHHAEMQLVGFVNAQPRSWQGRVGRLELHNRSRTGPTWGYSACNPCLTDLAAFLTALNRLPRHYKIRASISWERLYNKNKACGHPTDAATIDALVRAGWDEPMGRRPAGTRWPTTREQEVPRSQPLSGVQTMSR